MIEETKTKEADTLEAQQSVNPSPSLNQVVSTDWSMFKKETELGEGAYGTVFKVKCLKNSIVSGNNGQRIALDSETNAGLLRRKLNIRSNDGVNMASCEGKKIRSLLAD
jgi:hypothetical protein